MLLYFVVMFMLSLLSSLSGLSSHSMQIHLISNLTRCSAYHHLEVIPHKPGFDGHESSRLVSLNSQALGTLPLPSSSYTYLP